MNLDPATGVTSGTSTSAMDMASYSVTGSNSAGTVSTIVNITVVSVGKFTHAGNMAIPRTEHTATLLPDGKVLVAAGANESNLSSAELYEP
ncbi:kelch repeat-containing protein [Burkholderia diffusa]|uniref:kelch repeat-containing protein n=2 Tax=Burkholderia diffusa TaxID=488732 RepID=UPI000B2B971D|nr:kelch repeat-containing protein [Burkholderia diffusa]